MAQKIDWEKARKRDRVWRRGSLSIHWDGWSPENSEEKSPSALKVDRAIDATPPDTRPPHCRFEATYEFSLVSTGVPQALIVFHLVEISEPDARALSESLTELKAETFAEAFSKIKKILTKRFQLQNGHSKEFPNAVRMDIDVRKKKKAR